MRYLQLSLENCQVKAIGQDGERRFSGYASKFGGFDAYGDRVMKGAFEKTLQNRTRPVRMRWNHYGPVIGVWEKMYEDDIGLYVEGSLTPGHSVAEDAYASLRHGAVDAMSIGYIPREEEMVEGVNELREIELIEVSLVEEPADLGAKISEVKEAHRIINDFERLKDCEDWLRNSAGLSKSAATAIVARVKALSLGEPAEVQEQKQSDSVAPSESVLKGMSFDLMKHYVKHSQKVTEDERPTKSGSAA